jgi:hypothetical protein
MPRRLLALPKLQLHRGQSLLRLALLRGQRLVRLAKQTHLRPQPVRKLGLRPAFFSQRIELRHHRAGGRGLILQRDHACVRAGTGAAIADIVQFVDPFRRRGELVVPLVDREALLVDLAEGLDLLLNREPIVDRAWEIIDRRSSLSL